MTILAPYVGGGQKSRYSQYQRIPCPTNPGSRGAKQGGNRDSTTNYAESKSRNRTFSNHTNLPRPDIAPIGVTRIAQPKNADPIMRTWEGIYVFFLAHAKRVNRKKLAKCKQQASATRPQDRRAGFLQKDKDFVPLPG
jgi:hypothetical protein